MQDATRAFLRMIYMDAKSGCEAITGILPKIETDALRFETASQLEAYTGYAKRAEKLMQEKEISGITFSLIDRLTVRGSVIVETAGVQSETELTHILETNARESARRMQSAAHSYAKDGCDSDVLALGQNMIHFEMRESERLSKGHLS